MKTMKLGDQIRRVKEEQVAMYLANGWNYCPRSEWKKKVRDVEVKKVEEVKDENPQKKNKQKQQKKNKSKK